MSGVIGQEMSAGTCRFCKAWLWHRDICFECGRRQWTRSVEESDSVLALLNLFAREAFIRRVTEKVCGEEIAYQCEDWDILKGAIQC